MKKTKRKFTIWKFDYGNKNNKTERPIITIVDDFKILGITKNGSLVLMDKSNKKRWVKKEYFNSSYTPMWNGHIIRENPVDMDITPVLAAITMLDKNEN